MQCDNKTIIAHLKKGGGGGEIPSTNEHNFRVIDNIGSTSDIVYHPLHLGEVQQPCRSPITTLTSTGAAHSPNKSIYSIRKITDPSGRPFAPERDPVVYSYVTLDERNSGWYTPMFSAFLETTPWRGYFHHHFSVQSSRSSELINVSAFLTVVPDGRKCFGEQTVRFGSDDKARALAASMVLRNTKLNLVDVSTGLTPQNVRVISKLGESHSWSFGNLGADRGVNWLE